MFASVSILPRGFLLLIAILASRAAWSEPAPRLWTVQAIQLPDGVTCDAAAQGASGRPGYEVRFRRDAKSLLLIVAYDGPGVRDARSATILLDGEAVGTFPAIATRFGERAAVAISLDPASVDFADLERHRSMTIRVGADRFGMGFLPSDHLAAAMDQCVTRMLRR
jgi:hypothetical protein